MEKIGPWDLSSFGNLQAFARHNYAYICMVCRYKTLIKLRVRFETYRTYRVDAIDIGKTNMAPKLKIRVTVT